MIAPILAVLFVLLIGFSPFYADVWQWLRKRSADRAAELADREAAYEAVRRSANETFARNYEARRRRDQDPSSLVEHYEREPMPPEREIFDSEGYEFVRSDEEMQTLFDRYKAAHADWVKRGSPLGPRLHVLAGVPTTTGKFVTASGAKAEGVLLPDGTWRWTKVDWSVR